MMRCTYRFNRKMYVFLRPFLRHDIRMQHPFTEACKPCRATPGREVGLKFVERALTVNSFMARRAAKANSMVFLK